MLPLFGFELQGVILYDSGGFETPRFTAGPLQGQDPANGPWFPAGSGGSATVQAGTTGNATGVVAFNRINGDGRFGVIKPVSNVAPSPNGNTVIVEWSMSYASSTAPAGSFGPFFAVEVYDMVAGAPLLASAAGIDAKTGDVVYQAPITGAITEAGLVVTPNSWNTFRLEMSYASDTYRLLVNGTELLGPTGFVDPGINGLNDVDFGGLAAGGDPGSLNAQGLAFFDNFRIQQVPEPSCVALAAIGILALAGRRRFSTG